jgi:outer membrane murein-binding lipoprotein Lpp
MDYIGIIGALVGVLTLGGGVITFFVTWGKINQRVDDQAADIAALVRTVEAQADDIEAAQRAAGQAQGVGTAIEHLAENVKNELKHIGELFALNNQHITAQLADIKDQLKTVRGPSAARERRAN